MSERLRTFQHGLQDKSSHGCAKAPGKSSWYHLELHTFLIGVNTFPPMINFIYLLYIYIYLYLPMCLFVYILMYQIADSSGAKRMTLGLSGLEDSPAICHFFDAPSSLTCWNPQCGQIPQLDCIVRLTWLMKVYKKSKTGFKFACLIHRASALVFRATL